MGPYSSLPKPQHKNQSKMSVIEVKKHSWKEMSYTTTELTLKTQTGVTLIQVNISEGGAYLQPYIAHIMEWNGLQMCAYKYILDPTTPCELCSHYEAMCAYIRTHYPKIRIMEFKDDTYFSDFTLRPMETIGVSYLSFALQGQTYFESKFAAVPKFRKFYNSSKHDYELIDVAEVYNQHKHNFFSTDYKSSLDFIEFALKSHLVSACHMGLLNFKDIEELYGKAKTLKDFVNSVHDQLKIMGLPVYEHFYFFRYWLPSYVDTFLENSMPQRWRWNLGRAT